MEEVELHPKASNCNIGCRVPFLSFITDIIVGAAAGDDPETECNLLLESLGSGPSNATNNGAIVSAFEELLDKFGLECVVFLPITEASQPTGKKCVLRSKLGEGKVEIRLRFDPYSA
jgi:hypothetical protein